MCRNLKRIIVRGHTGRTCPGKVYITLQAVFHHYIMLQKKVMCCKIVQFHHRKAKQISVNFCDILYVVVELFADYFIFICNSCVVPGDFVY